MKDNLFLKLYDCEFLQDFLADPLLLAVLVACATRARRIEEISPEGLEQGEFFLSQTEFKKFGLASSQKDKLERRKKTLEKMKIIEKTSKRIGSERSIVWVFKTNQIVTPLFQISTGTSSEQVANKYRTSSEQVLKESRRGEDKKKASQLAEFLEKKPKIQNSEFSTPDSLSEEIVKEIADKFVVSQADVEKQKQALLRKVADGKFREPADYREALENFVDKALNEFGSIKKIQPEKDYWESQMRPGEYLGEKLIV